jgi:hypothetical protein
MNRKKIIIFFLCILPFLTFLEREFLGVFLTIYLIVLFNSNFRRKGILLFIFPFIFLLFKFDLFLLYLSFNFLILFFCYFNTIQLSRKEIIKLKRLSFLISFLTLPIASSAQIAFFLCTITVILWEDKYRNNIPWIILVLLSAEITGSRTSTLAIIIYSVFKIFPRFSNFISRNYLKVFFTTTLILIGYYAFIITKTDYEDLLYIYDPRLLVSKLFFENTNFIEFIFGGGSINNWDNVSDIPYLNVERWQFLHNVFLSILSLGGIVGVFIFIYLFINVIKSSSNKGIRYFFALLPFSLFFDNFIFYPIISLSIVILSQIQLKTHEKYIN